MIADQYRKDLFLWLERPIISQIKEVLLWAEKHAKRITVRKEDIYSGRERIDCDVPVRTIAGNIKRDDKNLFRIVLRRGLNEFLLIPDIKSKDILDIGISCINVDGKFYYLNMYVDGSKVLELRKEFKLTEEV
ncbi:MAG: hypothetical protein ABH869_05225 [Candidatus Omnitrophota bacterium]